MRSKPAMALMRAPVLFLRVFLATALLLLGALILLVDYAVSLAAGNRWSARDLTDVPGNASGVTLEGQYEVLHDDPPASDETGR